jgi:hypothetical protein
VFDRLPARECGGAFVVVVASLARALNCLD